ncbi:hypothetical protein [Psychromarinibacter sp. S121]|uniref:hypothetical protein n=1 Tax=Psychromarinibacter sp. S121 TaxID=3415127 RepID=UPI003C7DDE48
MAHPRRGFDIFLCDFAALHSADCDIKGAATDAGVNLHWRMFSLRSIFAPWTRT